MDVRGDGSKAACMYSEALQSNLSLLPKPMERQVAGRDDSGFKHDGDEEDIYSTALRDNLALLPLPSTLAPCQPPHEDDDVIIGFDDEEDEDAIGFDEEEEEESWPFDDRDQMQGDTLSDSSEN